MENKHPINGFFYMDKLDMVCVKLSTEKKTIVPKTRFQEVIDKYSLTNNCICLCNLEGEELRPVYKFCLQNKIPISNIDFDKIIEIVYEKCIELTKRD